jgi:transcriptional regulator with XRE-family HTH domain
MGRAARIKQKRLAEKLLQIRLALGFSQNEMIRHLGIEDISYQTNLSGFELGKREPPLLILLRYAEAAGVWMDVLVNDDLDLPEKLPSSPKHEGIKRASASRRKNVK